MVGEHKQKVLITGSTGLLGSTLSLLLSKDPLYDIQGLSVDIRDRDAVLDACKGEQYNWVIHTAAITNVGACEKDQENCYKTNFLGTKNVRDLAKNVGASLIYISTVSVFSGGTGNYKEHDIPYPKNFYNLCKLLGEQAVLEYEKGLVLRINLIGIHPEGSRGKNLFEWLIDTVKDNKDMTLFDDVFVNPLSNWTLAEKIKKIIEMNPTEKILHLGSKDTLSKADIGSLVEKHFPGYSGTSARASVDSLTDGAERPKQIWLNTDYAEKKLKMNMPTLTSEVEKILSNYKM